MSCSISAARFNAERVMPVTESIAMEAGLLTDFRGDLAQGKL